MWVKKLLFEWTKNLREHLRLREKFVLKIFVLNDCGRLKRSCWSYRSSEFIIIQIDVCQWEVWILQKLFLKISFAAKFAQKVYKESQKLISAALGMKNVIKI